uniref:Uncharacterized protein n=1 Tax=Oryza rufipogon TaxID=4529 RepID=A0A0E0MVZ2_ORYRU
MDIPVSFLLPLCPKTLTQVQGGQTLPPCKRNSICIYDLPMSQRSTHKKRRTYKDYGEPGTQYQTESEANLRLLLKM